MKFNFKLLIFLFLFLQTTALFPQIHIKAVGDVMPGSKTPTPAIPPKMGEEYVESLGDTLKGADIIIANLEGTFVTEKMKANKCSKKSREKGICYEFGMPCALLQPLLKLGFNAFTADNNHSMDYGAEAYNYSKKFLSENGVTFASKKKSTQLLVKLKPVALVAFSCENDSYNISDLKTAKNIIENLKKSYEIIIVSFHGGAEGRKAMKVENKTEFFLGENRGNVVEFAHTVIDAGASVVLGHGPHVLRAMEIYKGKLIAYSLGNFLTYGHFNLAGPNGIACILDFNIDEKTGDFISGKIIPTKQTAPGIPYVDDAQQAVKLLQELCTAFGSDYLKINDDGEILKIK